MDIEIRYPIAFLITLLEMLQFEEVRRRKTPRKELIFYGTLEGGPK